MHAAPVHPDGDRPRLLDLFCCEGGASTGYHRAGFDVYGVDLFKHTDAKGRAVGPSRARYPFPSHQGDVLEVLDRLLRGDVVEFMSPDGANRAERLGLWDFVAAAASPPCQAYSITKHTHDNEHPELIEPVRDLLAATGLPYVIENVVGAPLRNPLMLCGSEFDLTAWDPAIGETVGYTPSKDVRAELLGGVDWMTLWGQAQSIPPAYTEHIGAQLLTPGA